MLVAADMACFGHYWDWGTMLLLCIIMNALSACIDNRFGLSKQRKPHATKFLHTKERTGYY